MGFSFGRRYLPVSQQDTVEDPGVAEKNEIPATGFEFHRNHSPYDLKHSTRVSWIRWLPWSLILCLLLSNLYTWTKLKISTMDNAIYSPASSALKYKNIVWTAGVEESKSPYQGLPTEENNRLWEDLYQFGVDRIPMSQASQLVNRTTPIKDDPGYYMIILDVFHELHCLNMIRKRIFRNESEPEDEALGLKHMDHCIDSLRQSLMCSSDITPIPYAWYPKFNSVLPATGVMHTCRDFDAIRDWARERRSVGVHLGAQVEDPLGNVVHDIPES